MQLKMKEKAQVFSGEFLMAYFIFMIVLTLTLFLWSHTTREIRKVDDFRVIEERAVDVGEQLLRTTGYPKNWTAQDVITIGLANESRTLDGGKLQTFILMMDPSLYNNSCSGNISNYNCSKYLLGLGQYHFYFTMTDLNGTLVDVEGSQAITGVNPVNEANVLTITRTAIYDEIIVKIIITVWSEDRI